MYNLKKISVVLPAYNEEEGIGDAVSEFKNLGFIDEVLVVDNNSTDRTAEIATGAGARVVKEQKQGYGYALRKGMAEARGSCIILCEPDGTFVAEDSRKLLEKLTEHDFVLGSRTWQKYISPGANMGFFLRFGNIAVAKITQFLFPTGKLSDCGCTYRAMRKQVATTILPELTVGGPHFLPETVIAASRHNFKIAEIPVHYRKRKGMSKITGSKIRALRVGARMLKMVVIYKLLALA